MPFKPDLVANPPTALTGFGVLAVSGADAAAFLQAQTMNDVQALAAGQWHWNGWLTPKGRVVALFALLRAAPDRFLLVLPDVPADELRVALQRFVFRSKVALATSGLIAAAGPAHPDARGGVAADEGDAFALAIDGERTLWLLSPDRTAPPSPAVDAAWRAADIATGVPRLGAAQREAWTPQMLSLERLAAYSLKKGCYPGQEIVARTHYLGHAKRGLTRLRGDGLAEGDPVLADGHAAGTVICVTVAGDEALAVIAADATAPFSVAGRGVERVSLNGTHDRVT
jgi:folate-binding protein YgfZ